MSKRLLDKIRNEYHDTIKIMVCDYLDTMISENKTDEEFIKKLDSVMIHYTKQAVMELF